MANMYRSVLSGGGTAPTGDAVAADVLTGKTFSNANAVGIAGTMPNRGAVSGQATPSQPYTIPAGYHNGSGTVTASGVPYISFTASGHSGTTVATNCTVGKYYIISSQEGSGEPTVTGASVVNKVSMQYTNTWIFFVLATASTITITGGGAGVTAVIPIELG